MDRRVGLAWLLAFGCGDDGSAGTENGSGITVAPTSGIEATGSTTEEIKLDAGMETSATSGNAEDGNPSGCTKVDVVISVDNSSSMTEEIAALQGPVFDSFPTTLLDVNNGLDNFQLGLIDACPKPAALQDTGADGACDFSTGANYMVSTSPDLAGEFSCATELPFMAGWSGGPDACEDSLDDDEQPAFTAASVVSPPFAGDTNVGFLRNDALLMAVAITDEDEALVDAGDAQEIFDKFVAAKGGDVTRVAFLGIAGGSDCDGAYGSANDAVVEREVAALFEAEGRGMFWDLCDGQLEVAFQTFIESVVDQACTDFVPEG